MKKLLIFCMTLVASSLFAQEGKELYDLLDLDRPGLERVKKACEKGDIGKADKELLKYFRSRTSIQMTDIDLNNVKNTEEEQRWADESLEHKFHAHKGYESYFYGKDIDWRYWPVEDNELRWQLHRHYWFLPLAKAYYKTSDDKYAAALVEHYTDWVKKNPLLDIKALQAGGASAETVAAERENLKFAWRPMEVSHRLQNQPMWFELIKQSPRMTPDFLNLFLQHFHEHADYLLNHYSEKGNHLLFEAQRMVYAGIFFPEFKDAAAWRQSGIEILNREIDVQVFPDGVQFELDYGYHMATIDIFLKALYMARANGFDAEFPDSYVEKVGRMTSFVWNLMFPDYSNPTFSDTKLHAPSVFRNNYRKWMKAFPEQKELEWFATEGRKGAAPDHTSWMFPDGGYYVLRNGWDKKSTVVEIKAGPEAFWHNQPDNGTFIYWRKGRNFFPDSGSYVYAGNAQVTAEREWFRQTRVHNTLTLDNRNLESTASKRLLWDDTEGCVKVVVENESYPGLTHRRSFFLLDGEVLVIADEVAGEATGEVGVHFNLAPGEIRFDRDGTMHTLFADGNNIKIKTSGSAVPVIELEEGWTSTEYRKKEKRPAYVVKSAKTDAGGVLFVTVIAPDDDNYKGSIAIVAEDTAMDDTLQFDLRVGAKTYRVGYEL